MPDNASTTGPGARPADPDATLRTPTSPEPTKSRPAGRPAHLVRQRVWTAGRLLLLVAGLCATFGVFFLTAFSVASRAREVRVPDLRGKTVAEATSALSRLGLTAAVDPQRRPDAKVPADHVLAQDPDPGRTLRSQRAVRLRVSDGQRDPVVPGVLGQAEQTAASMLASNGISVAARIDVRTTDDAVGSVVAQDPPAKGRAQAVTLLINRGIPDRSFVMPDVIGTLGDRAAEALRSQGFRVAPPSPVSYPGLPVGVVVRQTPQAGYRVAQDELIVLEVSK